MLDKYSWVRKYEAAIEVVLIVSIVGGVAYAVTARHGLYIWWRIIHLEWPTVAFLVLCGLGFGVAMWKWFKDSTWRWLFRLVNMGLALVFALQLTRSLSILDPWLGVLVAVTQVGITGLVETILNVVFRT